MSTSPDFSLQHVRILHLEVTTSCQAKCAQCARESTDLYLHARDRAELTLNQLQDLFDIFFFQQLTKILLCGNFGDPAVSQHTLPILKWLRTINPKITIGMNTNGGIRDRQWWQQLANLCQQHNDYVVFSIDGLEDTNHIYRQGVDWQRLMDNVKCYIGHGGIAHWDMLIYAHNEHQVDRCRELARTLGFTWFRAKVSDRFNSFPVQHLQPPVRWQQQQSGTVSSIRCHALSEQSLYVAATGEILPCCFIGSKVFARDTALQQALNTPGFQGVIEKWDSDPLSICLQKCGVVESCTNFESQFRLQESLQ